MHCNSCTSNQSNKFNESVSSDLQFDYTKPWKIQSYNSTIAQMFELSKFNILNWTKLLRKSQTGLKVIIWCTQVLIVFPKCVAHQCYAHASCWIHTEHFTLIFFVQKTAIRTLIVKSSTRLKLNQTKNPPLYHKIYHC